MGNGPSTTNTTVQEAISNIMMNVLVSNTQNCSSTSSIVQSISASAGNNSAIVISDNKIDSTIKSQLTCLMTAQLTQSSLSQIQSQLQNSIANSTIMFPNITSATTNNNLKQSFASYVSTNVNMSNVLAAAQQANIDQEIIASGGNNSSIIISGNDMTAGMDIFTQACTDAATTALQNFASSVIGSGTATTEEVNALKPFADTAISLGNNLADIASSGFNAMSSTAKFGMFMMVMVAIIFIAMNTKMKDMVLGIFNRKKGSSESKHNVPKLTTDQLLTRSGDIQKYADEQRNKQQAQHQQQLQTQTTQVNTEPFNATQLTAAGLQVSHEGPLGGSKIITGNP
jgi:hypothetical protein